MEVIVHITEETIRDALMVPTGNQSLLIRNSTQEINDTFMQMGELNFTFKDLIQGGVELSLRLYTQHFTHGKATRYTRLHRRIAAMFSKAITSRHRLNQFCRGYPLKTKGFCWKSKVELRIPEPYEM